MKIKYITKSFIWTKVSVDRVLAELGYNIESPASNHHGHPSEKFVRVHSYEKEIHRTSGKVLEKIKFAEITGKDQLIKFCKNEDYI